jgi:hypothetical protein
MDAVKKIWVVEKEAVDNDAHIKSTAETYFVIVLLKQAKQRARQLNYLANGEIHFILLVAAVKFCNQFVASRPLQV